MCVCARAPTSAWWWEGLLPGPLEQLLLAGYLSGLQPSFYRGLPAITRDGEVLEGLGRPQPQHAHRHKFPSLFLPRLAIYRSGQTHPRGILLPLKMETMFLSIVSFFAFADAFSNGKTP